MNLPALYKKGKSKTGAVQVYLITVDGNAIITSAGQVNGKLTDNITICEGKNIGKANETSPEEQAILEAKAKHEKKIKSGYTLNPSGEILVLLPQKVKNYKEHKDKIKGKAYSTPKLNGLNGTYWLLEDGSLKLTSRGGEEFPKIPHLEPEIINIMNLLDTTCLNGELYIHGEHLQDITSAVKKTKELSKRLTFHIFEAPYIAKTYEKRQDILYKLIKLLIADNRFEKTNVHIIVGTETNSEEERDEHFDQCIADGYEGTVIYLPEAPYEFNERSSYVFKYKKPDDAEFKIISYEIDKSGHPVFICETNTKQKKTFNVKPKGTDSERKEILANIKDYLNQWYKIEFEVYSKDGKPLKPVGIERRDCNSNGEPLV